MTNGFIKKVAEDTKGRKMNWQRSIKQIMNGGMAMSSYKIIKKSIAESRGKGRI